MRLGDCLHLDPDKGYMMGDACDIAGLSPRATRTALTAEQRLTSPGLPAVTACCERGQKVGLRCPSYLPAQQSHVDQMEAADMAAIEAVDKGLCPQCGAKLAVSPQFMSCPLHGVVVRMCKSSR